ncbi:hypothetical protein ACFV3R_14230 [Streptomyces sp. NPDC059740]|uniref:hypothetical protein n=1 Tax=Streptomyces sp. NPDC059740 TaxID=3346926 RepID=UPI0036661968
MAKNRNQKKPGTTERKAPRAAGTATEAPTPADPTAQIGTTVPGRKQRRRFGHN